MYPIHETCSIVDFVRRSCKGVLQPTVGSLKTTRPYFTRLLADTDLASRLMYMDTPEIELSRWIPFHKILELTRQLKTCL